jgi:integrative and conjugative element protein (TIGR02256 family)
MIFPFTKSFPEYSVVGQLDESCQKLWIAPSALYHVNRHLQLSPWSSEAGGQLFGTMNAEQVCVAEASGPYAGDERSRYRYRSNPVAAQRAIEERHKRGLLYLGEWHTHAENNPSASSLDDNAMRLLISSSQLNSDSLLMMIVGRARGAAGLAVWCVSGRKMSQWILSESSESIPVSE